MNGAVMFPSSVRTNTTLYKLSLHMRSGGRMRVCSLSGIISTHTVPEMSAPYRLLGPSSNRVSKFLTGCGWYTC